MCSVERRAPGQQRWLRNEKKKREERNETEETPEPSRKKFVKAAAGRRRERVEVAKEEKHLRDNVYGGNSAPAV